MPTCPADVLSPSGTVCRAAAGSCDLDELCDGVMGQCPTDQLATNGTPCRPATSTCDVAEYCTGTNAYCPTESYAALGTPCGMCGACGLGGICTDPGTAGTDCAPLLCCPDPVTGFAMCVMGSTCSAIVPL
jgi:hypothetical protein